MQSVPFLQRPVSTIIEALSELSVCLSIEFFNIAKDLQGFFRVDFSPQKDSFFINDGVVVLTKPYSNLNNSKSSYFHLLMRITSEVVYDQRQR